MSGRLRTMPLLFAIASVAACGSRAPAPSPPPRAAEPIAERPASEPPLPDEAPEPVGVTPGGPEVTIKFLADAARKAHIFWGRKDLGQAPLEIHRPRGSGPLDLLIVAPGFLPLHTRAFTDRDEILPLRLYDEAAARGLLGHPVGSPQGDTGKDGDRTSTPSRRAKPDSG